MLDGPKFGDDLLEQVVGEHQGVAAGEEHVPDLLMLPDILDTGFDLLHGHGAVLLPGEPATGAVAAVHGALVGDQEQHPVRVPMGQALHGGIRVLVEGVRRLVGGRFQLVGRGDGLAADGIVFVVEVDKGQVVGGDGHAQPAQGPAHALLLFLGQVHVLLQVLQGLHPVLDLPVPVVPQLIRHIPEQPVPPGVILKMHIQTPYAKFYTYFSSNKARSFGFSRSTFRVISAWSLV